METLDGLSNLAEVTGDISIISNHVLTDCQAEDFVAGLFYVGGPVDIHDNAPCDPQ